MKGYLVLVMLAAVGIIKSKKLGNGGRLENTEKPGSLATCLWYPTMRASIEYDIWYPNPAYYELNNHLPHITFYYTGENTPNLRYGCNKQKYGQLYNKDLAIPLNEALQRKLLL